MISLQFFIKAIGYVVLYLVVFCIMAKISIYVVLAGSIVATRWFFNK